MAEEGTRVPGKGTESHSNPSIVEQKARDKGWKSREETDLPEGDWVDAKEFIGRQKLFDQIHDLKRQVVTTHKKYQTEMAQMTDYLGKVQEIEYKKAVAQLEREKKLAIADNNIEAVDQINQEIRQTEKDFDEAKKAVPKQPQGQNPEDVREFQEWQSKNGWFSSDTEMRNEALSLGAAYGMQNPTATQTDILRHVESRIKKIYSEKFSSEGKQPVKHSAVEPGGMSESASISKKAKGLRVADLSEQELQVMRTFVKRGVLKDRAEKNKVSQEQQYLNDLAAAGRVA